MSKIVVIGVDGGDPELFNKWINEKKLPIFEKIKQNGVSGKLKSTTPPFSAPAWTSIVTGCNPGKHGIYGFETTGTLEPHLINSRHRKMPAIWNYLTALNKTNIIINVPVTYPPENIRGVMITGLLTPSSDAMFTYPNEIKARLHENDLGVYDFEQLWLQDFSRTRLKKRSPKTLAQTINNQMNTRATVALNLMKEIPWDFSMIVFRGTDTAQHFLFEKKDLLLICYQKIDELIGKIINTYPEATYFIISDHGFEQVKKIFYPDNILYNHHLLIPTQNPYTSIRSFTYWFLYKLLQQLLQILPQESIKKSKFFKSILFSGASKSKIIDFSKTKAFSVADGRGIQICHNGLGSSGIVSEVEYDSLCKMIMNNLKETKDCTTKSPIIDKVYHWKEIYGDDALNHPDIVFDLHQGYTACEWIRFPETFPDFLSFKKRNIPTLFSTDTAGRSGDHAQYGIFFAYGKGIKTNMTLSNIKVQDILPTIFLSMNINHPPNIDGSAHTQIFSHEHIPEFVDWGEKNISPTMLNKQELNSIQHLRKQLFLKKTKNI